MRELSAGVGTGGRLAVVGLFAALAGGLFWAPAAMASSPGSDAGPLRVTLEVEAGVGEGMESAEVPERGEPVDGLPVTGSSWTLRRAGDAPNAATVSRNTGGTPETNSGNVSGSVDTGLPIGSSWT